MTKVAPAPAETAAIAAPTTPQPLGAAAGPASPKAAVAVAFVQITGAQGGNAATLNGVYRQQKQDDVYRKVDGIVGADGKEGVWLYYATDRRWHVTSRTANKDARKPCEHSYGHTITAAAADTAMPPPPQDVKGGWLVDLGGDDVGESVKESSVAVAAITADEAARLAAAAAASWDAAVAASAATGDTVLVAGTTGPRKKYIDGRYRRMDGRAAGQAPVYELVLPENQKGEHGVHLGVGCDGCGACPIHGLRMKCQTAGCDYDLCTKCHGTAEKKAAHADGKHTFAAHETKRWLYLSHVGKWFIGGVAADMAKRLNRGFAFSAAAVPEGTLPTAITGFDVGGEVQSGVTVTVEGAGGAGDGATPG